MEPLKTKQEALVHAGRMSAEVARRFGISYDEAARRVSGLTQSGILSSGHYADPEWQAKVDAFLSIPSRTYAHLK